jgi:hypothetical protein
MPAYRQDFFMVAQSNITYHHIVLKDAERTHRTVRGKHIMLAVYDESNESHASPRFSFFVRLASSSPAW